MSEFNSFFQVEIFYYIYNAAFCLSIYPNADAHLDCYHLLAIGHNAVMSLDVQSFHMCIFSSFGYVSN